ncbi:MULTISPECIES: cation-translocating P-type ATPase [Enterococcus]|uniref:P-type Ca(2+) transporter n=1 Tax=Enterococcus malodoratus ATCC 43197 TaxID=1158601 RepID=R2R3L0_9ENTE|nr:MULTISPECIES: cation-translocating P-type ATPase [Enterococcus]EOH75246.1 potassium/sodium efflux P-type ATPase, fungal-type [Enterococcus malodoratus ATCC 43197]EOT66708.1 potassium/sodium efflux P-type ATPase, fungal-type [Enterococcus malodoratus ATCC 43197]OJG65997.1 potassium/sodium efflux P-type ATPase, fungal-type [Enterococcus malodoratus]SPW90730.1 potassium/sodium efflux P-type ATPase, fungal-type [Enterococcus malodoratus]STD70039.1 potassium/sodium efflux P-type ATPase, fungal-t
MTELNKKQSTTEFYAETSEAVLMQLKSSVDGLSGNEAQKRLAEYGKNELAEGKKKSLFVKFAEQFKDFMILVLLAAAIISAVVSHEVVDSIIILLVVIINAIMGVFQEAKAEQAIEALKQMSTPNATVLRDGHTLSIKSDELVPGDIVLLEAGDVVPADIRLLEAASLKIEEAALTGESVPVEKEITVLPAGDIGIGDRINMAFSNSNVTYGRGKGVVVTTGMSTEVGKIADMLAQADETETPLKNNLNDLGKFLTLAIIAIAVIMFIVGTVFNGTSFVDMLLTSISLAVAAIPEGLPAIVTIILALGTQVMAKRNSVIRKLPAVETLGSTDIIASDKTGTLTLNQMTVEKLYTDFQQKSAKAAIEKDNMALKIMNYANDTKIAQDGTLIGDPTETALVQFGIDQRLDLKESLGKEPRIGELPFDSDRKLMSTIHQLSNGKYLVAVKGAPDVLIQRTTRVLAEGQETAMSEKQRNEILFNNADMAKQALRVLAMAFKYLDEIPQTLTSELLENDLCFAGLVGMIDPERAEAAEAVKMAKDAGIRPIMITGDHKDTAEAIAVRLGIVHAGNSDAVLTGAELNEMSDEEFAKQVYHYSVYARVSPEHKVRIVKAWQQEGKVVAMTGDGVNDAPSLKQADIGIGMGITGTEVSKGASDMVLADDNFATIVVAVEEGRKVFSNIQKTVQYLLAANLGEVLTLFIATMFAWDTLLPIHLLWINLVTDTFPAIALGMEPAEKDLMSHKPRGRRSNLFSGGVFSSIIYQGILEGGLTLFVYWFAIQNPAHTALNMPGLSAQALYSLQHADALTMCFATLGFMQLFHAFNVKSVKQSIFKVGPFRNKTFNWAILLSFALMGVIILVPGLNDIFRVASLNGTQWGVVAAASFSIIPIVEVVKFLQRKTSVEKVEEAVID